MGGPLAELSGFVADRAVDTLPRMMEAAATRFGEDIAITEGEFELSWASLDALRQRVARAFLAAGIRKGDGIAIWAPNTHEWIATTMGRRPSARSSCR